MYIFLNKFKFVFIYLNMTQENQYLEQLKNILENGERRSTRNGYTKSIFGSHMRFDISQSFPLLTTKKMFIKGIVEELLWFLRGSTDATDLQRKGVHIWDLNTSKEYLNSIGLSDYVNGETGPFYGYQWRNYGKPYIPYKHRSYFDDNEYLPNIYKDQIKFVIDEINNKPTSRRILLTAWNPNQLDEMCLPPCHVLYQFYVSGENNEYLSCHMYQRSEDFFLGKPFNIASTALLTYIIANITGKNPKEVIFSGGDSHIYEEHIDAVKTQLERSPFNFPKLTIKRQLSFEEINKITINDFELIDYESHSTIKAKLL